MFTTRMPLAAVLALVACHAQIEPDEPQPLEPPSSSPPPEITPASDDGVEVSGHLLAPIPTAVTSFGAATVGGHAYVLGGYFGKPHEYERQGQSRELWRLPIDGSGGWARVGELDTGLQGLALVAHGDEICRVGGTVVLNGKREPTSMRSVADVACFDTTARSWRSLPPLPAGRSSHDATVIGDTLYVAGGWRMGENGRGGDASGAVWHRDVLALDLRAEHAAWRSIEAPFERRALAVAALGERLVVLGGLTSSRAVSREVDVYDPATGGWSRGPVFPTDAFGVAAVTAGGKLYASARDGVIYRLDGEGWSRAGSLAFPRFFHRLVPSDDGLIALAGVTEMQSIGRTRHTERVRLDPRAAVVQQWTMPYPGAAKNRQGLFVHGDALYLFGGNDSLGQHDFAPDNFVNDGWRLHLPSMRFDRVAPYPHRRQTMQTLETDGLGLSVGGFGHPEGADGATQAVSHQEAYAFDFRTESWTPRPGLPQGRTQLGLTAHGDELWVFGGLDYDPSRKGQAAFHHVTTALVAPRSGESGFVPTNVELPGPRRAFAGAALGDHYYLVGGMKGGFELVDDCLRFDFTARSFEPFPCPARNRLSGELVALGGKLYLVGGSVRVGGEMTPDRTIEVFDPEAGTWRVLLDDVGFDTKHVRAAAYRERLLLVSTHTEARRIRVMLITPDGGRG